MNKAAIGRRDMLALGAAGVAVPVFAHWPAEPAEMLALWPGTPPGAPAVLPAERVVERSAPPALRDRIALNVARPALTVFRAKRPTGSAMLIIPGGAFIRVAIDKEGYETAAWLAKRGVTAFVLRYRFPGDGWRDAGLVPFQDAQRAMRLIRAHAGRLAISPGRVGVIGFSAGGLLAALLSTAGEEASYLAVDGADRLSARPALTGLVYAATTSGPSLPRPHGQLATRLLSSPAASLVQGGGPPTILFHAGDDTTVSPGASIDYYKALRAAGTQSALHMFEGGGHGFGLRLPATSSASRWPELFLAFARQTGLLERNGLDG
jgi:acetyl esterase/lipase